MTFPPNNPHYVWRAITTGSDSFAKSEILLLLARDVETFENFRLNRHLRWRSGDFPLWCQWNLKRLIAQNPPPKRVTEFPLQSPLAAFFRFSPSKLLSLLCSHFDCSLCGWFIMTLCRANWLYNCFYYLLSLVSLNKKHEKILSWTHIHNVLWLFMFLMSREGEIERELALTLSC